MKPDYVYVASSWRNPMQQTVVETLRAVGIDCYDFRNPPAGTGFSWAQVKTADGPSSIAVCQHCDAPISLSSFMGLGFFEPDVTPENDPVVWRHNHNGYAACNALLVGKFRQFAIPKKGSDWEAIDECLRMLNHPRAVEGYEADYAALNKADVVVMVLPCGKSAHLELGCAIGAGKRTAILLEDPVEPELMYRAADYLAPSLMKLLGWLGVDN